MKRLALPTLALAVAAGCMTARAEHAERVDPGALMPVTLHMSATDGGVAHPWFCAGLPTGWAVEGAVTYAGTNDDEKLSGTATPAPALVAKVRALRPEASWQCWTLVERNWSSLATGAASLSVRVPTTASGAKELYWVAEHDAGEPADLRTSDVFVGSEAEWELQHAEQKLASLEEDVRSRTEDARAQRVRAEAALAGNDEGYGADDVRSGLSSWKALKALRSGLDPRAKEAREAGADAERAALAIASTDAELAAWKELWPRLSAGVAGSAQAVLQTAHTEAGWEQAKVTADIDQQVVLALDVISAVGGDVALDPAVDGFFWDVMDAANTLGVGAMVQHASTLCLEHCKAPQVRAYAHFGFARLATTPEDRVAQCRKAWKTAQGTDLSEWVGAQCDAAVGTTDWKP